MVGLEELAMLDHVLWFRSGEAAAQRLHCAQSTVSRRNNETLRCFGLEMQRENGEWELEGDQTLLLMERRVHQMHRFLSDEPLCRLEGSPWGGPVLADPMPAGWVGGSWNHVGMERPLQLLRERVIDAWIGSYQPDMPVTDSEITVIDLCRTPVHLVAHPGHPLSSRQSLAQEDLDPFPSLSLPSGMFPKTEAILRSHGLWTTPARMARYKPELWEGQTADQVTLTYASCLALEVMEGLQVLPYDLGLMSGESLVVRTDLLPQPKILALLSSLRRSVSIKAKELPEIVLPH